jgi:hypothetical protein
MVARGLLDGRELWRRKIPKRPDCLPEPQRGICLAGNTVIYKLWGGVVLGVSAGTGEILWTFATGGDQTMDVALCGDRYHVLGRDGGYFVLDASTGRTLLKANLKSTLPGKLSKLRDFFPLLVSETHAWVGVGPGYLMAFDRHTGEYAWHRLPKGAGSFQGQTSFASANGRFYYSDCSARMYWLEEENPTDPVLKAQREGKGLVVRQRPAKAEAEPEAVPRLAFSIAKQNSMMPPETDVDGWRVWECRCQDARFFLAVYTEDDEPMSPGEGRIWALTVDDRERLLRVAEVTFAKKRRKARKRSKVQVPPGMLVMVLGAGRDEEGSDAGTWTHSKWTGDQGAPEFFVAWSEQEQRGAILEKDELFRDLLLDMFASLVVCP